MEWSLKTTILGIVMTLCYSCGPIQNNEKDQSSNRIKSVKAKDILGNKDYLAISYGGYRQLSRDHQPTTPQLKEDMKILAAMGIKVLRTYNVQLQQAPNLLKAISELKRENPNFEMYVMLGAWIDCKNAWTDEAPDHENESEQNEAEIARAMALANQYPDIVKIIAVGNEAMVRWAESYYVQPKVILKYVNFLQSQKKSGKLPKDLWITSSDDFVSWGGGDTSYHNKDLEALVKAVDYISMHTYPFHNTHYNPEFWISPEEENQFSEIDKINAAMLRAQQFAASQYDSVVRYVKSIDVKKAVHIGETGWATVSKGFYGNHGSKASDEYKQGKYYQLMREWTNKSGISCFYFEAFDEHWKDSSNPKGSENHFGIFTMDGKAKYAIWNLVDQGVFDNVSRDGHSIIKTYEGDKDALLTDVMVPPAKIGSAY